MLVLNLTLHEQKEEQVSCATVKHHAVALEKQGRSNWMGCRRREAAHDGGCASTRSDASERPGGASQQGGLMRQRRADSSPEELGTGVGRQQVEVERLSRRSSSSACACPVRSDGGGGAHRKTEEMRSLGFVRSVSWVCLSRRQPSRCWAEPELSNLAETFDRQGHIPGPGEMAEIRFFRPKIKTVVTTFMCPA